MRSDQKLRAVEAYDWQAEKITLKQQVREAITAKKAAEWIETHPSQFSQILSLIKFIIGSVSVTTIIGSIIKAIKVMKDEETNQR